MRAVAVGMVLLFHAGFPYVSGGFTGVDVFFVISGFLITSMLLREVERTGTISLSRFYSRRAKRLLPAATLVLAVTAVATWLLASVIDRRAFGGDIVSAALYMVNWRLAGRSVDYLAEDVGASPVQHFWSLAVEEQFYLIWPMLILLVAWWARREGEPARPWIAVGLCVVGAPSFVWSVMMTMSGSSAAFFVTTTRLWELAAGAAVAIAMPTLARLPRALAALLAWCGLAAVISSAFLITPQTMWPGYAAVLPVAGTAAVIAGGAAGRYGPEALLGTRPFVRVGALSYSLYLWHWPMIVLATAYWGELRVRWSLLIIALSVVPAWLAYRYVENPIRHAQSMVRSPKFALSVGANLSLAGVVAGMGLALATPTSSAPPDATRAPGAAVLGAEPRGDPDGRPVDEVSWITPDPIEAPSDIPPAYADGCQVSLESSEPASCEYGDPGGDVTIALVGDSKALQWITALDTIGRENGWRVVTYTKSTCSFTAATLASRGEVFESCSEWNDRTLDKLLDDPPDVIVTSQGKSRALEDPDDSDSRETVDAMIDGLAARWAELVDAGVKVAVLADTPQPGSDVYKCVAENRDRLTACAFGREDAITSSAAPVLKKAVNEFGRASWIDLNDAICPTKSCAAVIGNTLVYRQGSHLTVSYVDSLKPRLQSALEEIVG